MDGGGLGGEKKKQELNPDQSPGKKRGELSILGGNGDELCG